MALRLTRLNAGSPIVGSDGSPNATLIRWWQDACSAIETAVNGVAGIQAQIESVLGIANAAKSAAANAETAAGSVSLVAGGLLAALEINDSYVSGLALTANDAGTSATITISNHNRIYGDGSTVAVAGGALPAIGYGSSAFIFYDDPTRAGGVVAYVAATSIGAAGPSRANPNRHMIGAIVAPAHAAANTSGIGVLPSGVTLPTGFAYA